MLGAVAPPEDCADVFAPARVPKSVLVFVTFPSCGLLGLKIDPVVPPGAALLDGGSPAGVVEPNENPAFGLLAGVAFACPEDALEPALPKKPPAPGFPAVPNIFEL